MKTQAQAGKIERTTDFRLTITNGVKREVSLPHHKREFVIGRSPEADVIVNDSLVSRTHCRLTQEAGGWFIEDLGSTNGTWLWGQEISRRIRLPLKTPFNIGKITFEVRDAAFQAGRETVYNRIVFCGEEQVASEANSEDVELAPDHSLNLINRFQRAIATVDDSESVHQKILKAVLGVIDADEASLLQYDINQGAFVPVATCRVGAEGYRKELIDLAIEKREAILSALSRKEPGNMLSVICAPLCGRQQINGLLYLTVRGAARAFTKDDLLLMNVICGIAGGAVEQSELMRFNVKNEKLFATGETARNLSHHLKNVLFGIDGTLALLKTAADSKDNELVTECWNILKVNHRRLASMTLDFLSFAGDQKPKLRLFDVNQIIRDTVKNIKAQFDYHDVTVDIESVEGRLPLFAEVDPEGIHRVLLNLLNNAEQSVMGKHKQGSGEAMISVISGVDKAKGSIYVTVKDNGLGLDEEKSKTLFDLFASSKGVSGNGLGLHVCKRLVEAHGGNVSASGKAGEGCEVTFRLPLSRNLSNSDTLPLPQTL